MIFSRQYLCIYTIHCHCSPTTWNIGFHTSNIPSNQTQNKFESWGKDIQHHYVWMVTWKCQEGLSSSSQNGKQRKEHIIMLFVNFDVAAQIVVTNLF